MTRYGFLLSACLLACGPSPAEAPSGGEGQSDSVAEPKLDAPEDGTSSSSNGNDGCTEVVEGDLEVNDASDLDWLRAVREVHGVLTITELSGHAHLEFLGCLESVQGLWIKDTTNLRSLAGLGRLKTLERGLSVSGNASLETLRGLDSLESIGGGGVSVLDNPELSRLELESPRDIGYFRLGSYECDGYGPDAAALPRGDNPKLSRLDGFEKVEKVSGFVVEGQSAFSSTETIVDVLSRREPSPDGGLPDIRFHLNPVLGQDELDAVFRTLGLEDEFEPTPGVVCENQDDDNKCPCKGGE